MNSVKSIPTPNTKQTECIRNVDGKYLVLAGPGTGKTFTVTRRIKNMIEVLGKEPETILCLTFSNTAAKEMKNKIGEKYDVDVFTYHEFCLDILKNQGEEFGISNFRIITDTVKRNLIKECIDEAQLVAYNNEKNTPQVYADDILEGIEEIKKNRLSKSQFFHNLKNNPMWEKYLETLKKLQIEKPTKTREKEIESLKRKIDRMSELWMLYELYSQKMANLNYIDFSDMINFVLEKFEDENSNILENIAQKYKYILVDEYQDTNKSQNAIVFKLTQYCPNVFVVGDDDQIIYTFQGANLDTLENFLDRFPDVEVICLEDNNRSTQAILDVSQKIAQLQDKYCKFREEKAKTKKEKEFWATNNFNLRICSSSKFKKYNITKNLNSPSYSKMYSINNPIEYYSFESEIDERTYVIHKIKEIINSDKCPEKLSEIAILALTNDELKNYEIFLKANGIPVEITGGKNIFDISSVNTLITYMQFLVNPEMYSDKLLAYLLLKPFHISPKDYKTLWDYKSHHASLIDNMNSILKRGYSTDELKEKLEKIWNSGEDTLLESIKNVLQENAKPVYDFEKIKQFVKTYEYLQSYITSENYANSILEIGNKTGIFEHYINDEINKTESIKGINKLLEEAHNYFALNTNKEKSFSHFVDYLTKMMENDIKICLDKEEKPLNAVQLTTYHSSKGREFEYVFMPGLNSSKWESSTSSSKEIVPLASDENNTYEDVLDIQSQAKFLDNIKLLYVGMTRAKHTLVLSAIITGTKEGKLSWFIEQLLNDENLKHLIITPSKEEVVGLLFPKQDYDYKTEFKEFIENRFQKTYSASSLNTYRKCPREYFYNYILGFKSSSGNQDNLAYGTAVHEAFDFTIKYAMKNKKYPSADEAYRVFEESINSIPCSNPVNIKQNAKKLIFSQEGYFSKFINITSIEQLNSNSELSIKYSPEDDINFYGCIDRVDENQDGSYTIYDYKTGTDSTGITKGGVHSHYYYQIAFYKYLFKQQFKITAPIHTKFLYPLLEESEIIKEISDEEAEAIALEFIDIVKKINNFEFNRPAKCPNAKFCTYKNICSLNPI